MTLSMKWLLAITILLAGAYIIVDHQPHLLDIAVFGLILLCPLVHIFLHRNHTRHH